MVTGIGIEQVQLYEQKAQRLLKETRRAVAQHLSYKAKSAAAGCRKAAEQTAEAASKVIEQHQKKANDLALSAWEAARQADILVAAGIDPPEAAPSPVPEKPKPVNDAGPQV